MRADPGLSFKATTLVEAMALMQAALGARLLPATAPSGDGFEAVEEAATNAGMRCRRVILDGEWWRSGGAPMLARLADRRRLPRPLADGATPEGTGWVALLPNSLSGFRMVAAQPGGSSPIRWQVDGALAARLTPFAFTFHRTFAPRALGTGDILRFAVTHARADLVLLVATGLLAALIGLLTPVATGHLIDVAIPAGAGGRIGQVIAGLAAAGLSLIALDVMRTLAILRFEARTGVAVQAAILDRVISAPARFFRGFSSGDLALRMAAVNTVQRTLTGSSIGAFVTAIFLAANLFLMFAYSAPLALASLAVAGAAVAVSVAIGLARLKLGRRIEDLDGRLSALAFEYLTGIAKLRTNAAESRAFANWLARYRSFRSLNQSSARLTNLETVLLGLLQPAAIILVFWLAWRLANSGAGAALTTGEFIAFQAALFGLLGGLQVVVETGMDVLHLKPVWDRAKPILDTTPEDAARGKARHDPEGAIELAGVAFAYPDGPEVLSGIDLAVRPGEFVAIVGPSGSGKSTLLRLLLGFEAPLRGTVRFDGKDIAGLDLRHLRSRVGTVLQGGKLWAGDLYTNIVGAANVPVETAWDAAREAGLAPDIEALPMGMYTLVSEGLSTLSGGQRQRVLIARALVSRPRILLLDEATSALDNVAQAAVLESLEKREATRIVIAHRLNTVRHADRIVVLERGRIVQQGKYDELAGEPGPFAAMLARQVA